MTLGKRRRAATLLGFFAATQEQLIITKPANAVFVARPIMRSNAAALGGAAGRLRGSSVPISAGCLGDRCYHGVRRSGGGTRSGRPTSSIRMVFDQFDPRGRSKVFYDQNAVDCVPIASRLESIASRLAARVCAHLACIKRL